MLPYQKQHLAALRAHNFEGDSPWPYMDTHVPSLITVGTGCATNLDEMLTLDFRIGTQDGPKASEDYIRQAYNQVSLMTPGMWYTKYKYPGCLMLTQEADDALIQKRYDAFDKQLHKVFPKFDSFTINSQTGLLDLIWGLGEGGLEKYHELIGAMNATPPNYSTAAQQCAEKGEAYLVRNAWRAGLFLHV